MAERKDFIITDEEFPSNSHKSKETKIEKRVTEKVVKGKVKKKKKSLGSRMSESFLEDDSANVFQYILWDVLVPAAKNTISDVVTNAVQMFLFGENREPDRIRRDRNRSYVSYSSYYEDDRKPRHGHRVNRRASQNFDDIFFDYREDAEEVLDRLADLLDQYNMVTVQDLYDLVGITSNYTDQKWGWYNLNTARVVRCRDGYALRLPRTEEMEL